MDWLFWYLVGCGVSFLPLSLWGVHLITDGDDPDSSDIAMGILLGGVCCCWMWPLAIVVLPTYYLIRWMFYGGKEAK